MDAGGLPAIELLDWRRSVAAMYGRVKDCEDAREGWESWRGARDKLLRTHPQSPVPADRRSTYPGAAFFDYDPAFRVVADLRPCTAASWEFEAAEGLLALDRVASANFALGGTPQVLDLYWFRSYGGGLFLSFRDGTSGKLTYGGCRYLLDTVKGADLGSNPDGLVLDFNFAYQPSCAYDSRWVCPLAPSGNRMNLDVIAGERLATPVPSPAGTQVPPVD